MQALLAARKIAQHLQRRMNRRDRNEIGRRHLTVDPLHRAVDRLLNVLRLHRARVEKQRQETMAGDFVRAQGV